MADRLYNDEEAQQILQIAARGSVGMGGLSEAKLVETAAELGISPEEVYAAVRQFELDKTDKSDRIAYRQRQRRRLLSEISSWLSTSFLLVGINFLTNGASFHNIYEFWALWPVGIWGLVVLTNCIKILASLTINFEPKYQDWRRKKEVKEVKAAVENPLPNMSSPTAKLASEDANPQRLSH